MLHCFRQWSWLEKSSLANMTLEISARWMLLTFITTAAGSIILIFRVVMKGKHDI